MSSSRATRPSFTTSRGRPAMGRSYHLIATACKDKHVRIFRLKLSKERPSRLEVVHVTELMHHNSEVWRVQWNASGTILASTGDDGTVR